MIADTLQGAVIIVVIGTCLCPGSDKYLLTDVPECANTTLSTDFDSSDSCEKYTHNNMQGQCLNTGLSPVNISTCDDLSRVIGWCNTCGGNEINNVEIGTHHQEPFSTLEISGSGSEVQNKCVTLHRNNNDCHLHVKDCNGGGKLLCRRELQTTNDTIQQSTTYEDVLSPHMLSTDQPVSSHSSRFSTSSTPTVERTSSATPELQTSTETSQLSTTDEEVSSPAFMSTDQPISSHSSRFSTSSTPTVERTSSATSELQTSTDTSQLSTTDEEMSSPAIMSTDLPTSSHSLMCSTSSTPTVTNDGTIPTTSEGTLNPETTTTPLLTTSTNLAEHLTRFGHAVEELAKISHSEIGSMKFHESIDNASSSLARMSAQVDTIEAGFLPINNDGKTATLTSDLRKVTLNSVIVSFPTEALKDVKSAALAVVSTLYVVDQFSPDSSNEPFLGTAIVSISLEPKDGDAAVFDLKGHPIQIELIHLHNHAKLAGKIKRTCVYYNDVDGQWSAEGCDVVSEGDGSTTCSCSHLTNFAVLMQIDPEPNACIFKALDVLSVVGGVTSIICLALTLCAFALLKMFKVERNIVHGNLAFALLVSQLVFLTGIDAVDNRTACSVVAVLLHYFLLSSFSWMLIEGALLFVKAVFVFHRQLNLLKLMALGWGIPIPVVAITFAAVQPDGYGYSRDSPVCWLNGNAIWAFICPMAVVIALNTVFVFAVIRSYLRLKMTMDKTELAKIRGVLRALMSIQPLMGFTWLLGFGVSGHVVTCIMFVILNTLQGFFIFVLYCLKTDEVQTVLKRIKNKISPRRVEHLPNQLQMVTMSADNSTQNTSCDRKTCKISPAPIRKKAGWI